MKKQLGKITFLQFVCGLLATTSTNQMTEKDTFLDLILILPETNNLKSNFNFLKLRSQQSFATYLTSCLKDSKKKKIKTKFLKKYLHRYKYYYMKFFYRFDKSSLKEPSTKTLNLIALNSLYIISGL